MEKDHLKYTCTIQTCLLYEIILNIYFTPSVNCYNRFNLLCVQWEVPGVRIPRFSFKVWTLCKMYTVCLHHSRRGKNEEKTVLMKA